MLAVWLRCNMLGLMQPVSPLRFALAGAIAMAAFMGIGRFVYTPALPAMMSELGVTAGQAGLIASANFVGYLLGALGSAGSWASGRERPVMLVALAFSTLLAAAMALTQSVTAFVVIRFLAGLASAFGMIFISSIVVGQLMRAGRGQLQALHFGGVGAGIILSSLMTAALHFVGATWAATWIGSAVLSAIALVLVMVMVDRGSPVSANGGHEMPLPKDRRLTAMILAYGLFGFGYIVTATFLVAIVRQNGESSLLESVVWLVTGIAVLPSVYLWSRLAARIGLAKVFAIGAVVEAVGVVASVVLTGKIGPLVGGVLLGGTFVAITAIGLQFGRLVAPHSPRRVFALMTASFGVGQIIGPIFAGMLAEATGSFMLPSLFAALVLVIAGALVVRAD